jgi:hypothetical protein
MPDNSRATSTRAQLFAGQATCREIDAASASDVTPGGGQIESVKARLAVLRKKNGRSKAVREEINVAEREPVNAPVSGGRDPFEWLPDELMLMVLERVPFEALWGEVCERVCERWARLMESASIVRRKRDGRWPVGGVRGGGDPATGAQRAHEMCHGSRYPARWQGVLCIDGHDDKGVVG